MSESRPVFKFTAGDWGKHPAYEIKPMIVGEDTDTPWISCSVYLSSGHKVIAEVSMRTPVTGGGWPNVDNIPEMKANLALMSAAPDMLNLLVEISEMAMPTAIADKVKYVIAKATTF